MKRIAKLSVAAVLLIVAFAGIPQFFGDGNGASALAEAADQLKQATAVAWTYVFYENVTSKDGKTTWVRATSKRCIWRAPGFEREILLDAQSRVERITITDYMKGKRLVLEPGKKKARLSYPGVPLERTRRHSSDMVTHMSRWLSKTENGWLMGEPEPLGRKDINGREAIGYRVGGEGNTNAYLTIPSGSRVPWTADLWVDAKTKRLVLINNPGVNVYDPENDPVRANQPGEGQSTRWAMGSVYRDIVFDEEVDDSLFRLDPPEGYDVTEVGSAEPSEKEMIEWLGIRAQCNGGVFRDNPGPLSEQDVNKMAERWRREGKINAADKKEMSLRADRVCPVLRFAALTAGESWHYAGKGVKLGDETGIVCWYKPKDSKTYRVVYGDLSVKDVAGEELPLEAEE